MSIKAYDIVPIDTSASTTGYTAGVNAYLLNQGRPAASRAGISIIANAPYENYEIRETDGFQSLNKANPELNISTCLQELGLSSTPQMVYNRDGDPIALLANDGRAYTTQNQTQLEQETLRQLGSDTTLLQRASFIAQENGLTDHGMTLPSITDEHRELLRKKCPDHAIIPRLSRHNDLELLNNSDSITVINAPRSEVNPAAWSADSNSGVIFPGSPTLIPLLNSGAITDFSTRILPSPDGDGRKLLAELRMTLEGETHTYVQTRTKSDYLGGASLVIPFDPFGCLVYTSPDLEIQPNRGSFPVRFQRNNWKCTLIQGGIRYVSISSGDNHMGILKLPALQKLGSANQVTIGLDAGETSAATYLKVDQDLPRPAQLTAREDIFPLIHASAYDKKLICENQWLPLSYQGMARSKAQNFTHSDKDRIPPLPYVYVKPCINQTTGYQLENTPENRVFSGFKSDLVVCNKQDKEKLETYQGTIAAFLLLCIHDALKYSSNIHLRIAYPNNPAYRKKFEQNMLKSMKLVGDTLTDAKGRPFVFKTTDWRTEAFCCSVCIEVAGINDVIGSQYVRYVSSDMGGSTTDAAVRINRAGDKVMLPAIPIAGRAVTLGSMAQLARFLTEDGRCGLHLALRDTNPDMLTVLAKQVVAVVQRELKQGGNRVDALIGLSDNQELLEGIQTIIDYFPLKLDDDAGILLKSLICMKDLLIQDILLRQSSSLFDPEERQNTIHLLRLGNGSKCVDLICSSDNHYCDSHAVMSQVLQERMDRYMKGVPFCTTFNTAPKTEVALGLTTYDEQDGFTLDDLTCEGVESLAALKDRFLDDAVDLIMEQVQFLRTNVPRICGDIDPYMTGLERGFPQLLERLENREDCTSALLDTIRNEKGRFGSIYQVSARMGVSVWVAYSIMDAVNRQLAIIQSALMDE